MEESSEEYDSDESSGSDCKCSTKHKHNKCSCKKSKACKRCALFKRRVYDFVRAICPVTCNVCHKSSKCRDPAKTARYFAKFF
uniref:Uncharacterized protein n=1 Tax=Plectus sambesii TaxID=2011161 RepID=A0A914W179_9BILA